MWMPHECHRGDFVDSEDGADGAHAVVERQRDQLGEHRTVEDGQDAAGPAVRPPGVADPGVDYLRHGVAISLTFPASVADGGAQLSTQFAHGVLASQRLRPTSAARCRVQRSGAIARAHVVRTSPDRDRVDDRAVSAGSVPKWTCLFSRLVRRVMRVMNFRNCEEAGECLTSWAAFRP